MPTPREAIFVPYDPSVVKGPVAARPPVASRPISDRCMDVLLRAPGHMDDVLAEQFSSLLSPANLAIMTGTLAIMAANQWWPLGWVMDLLLFLGLISLGAMLFTVANEMMGMISLIANAKTEEDLDSAAKLLADIVGVIGINAVVGWLIGRCGGRLMENAKQKSFLFGEGGALAMSRQYLAAKINNAGMLPEHFLAVQQAARELNLIILFRNTNKAALPHLKRGAAPKPFSIKVKSDSTTGIVTCKSPESVLEAINAGDYYYVVERIAGKLVARNGKGKEYAFDVAPYWQLAEGQVIDGRIGKPVVGDYDLLGVVDPAAVSRNLVLAASDGRILPEWKNPALIRRVMDAINPKLDMPRVLHAAWDGFAPVEDAGVVTAFYPDGSTFELTASEAVGLYASWGRAAVVMPKWVKELLTAQSVSRQVYRR